MRALIFRLLTTAALGALIFGAFQAYNILTTSEKLEVKTVEIRGLSRVEEAEVEKLVADQKQLRLSVSRKAQGRIVKIDMTTPAGGKGLMGKLRSSLRRPRAETAPADDAAETTTQP